MSDEPNDSIPPWPAMPVDAPPMRVQSIGYSSRGMVVGRPTVITMIGVLSIVVASLGLVGGFLSAMSDLVFLQFTRVQTVTQVPQFRPAVITINPSGAAATVTSEAVGDHGMAMGDRSIVITGLSQLRRLSPARRKQVDELLAENGKDVLDLSGPSLTAERVAANVSDNGRLPSANGSDDGPDYFTLGQGRLEVADDHAVFFPSDGSQTIRTSAMPVSDSTSNDTSTSSIAASPNSPFTPAQIASILRRAKLMGARLSPGQTRAIIQTLQNPAQQFVVPTTDGSDPSRQILNAYTTPDGSTSFSTQHGVTNSFITFDITGQVTNSMTSTGPQTATKLPRINYGTLSLVLCGTVINLLLAIYLMISGIFVLRQSPVGARLHWIYLTLKIPMVLLTALASGAMVTQLVTSVSPTGGASASTQAVLWASALPALLGLLYPIALIFLLRSRGVREYYGGVGLER
jgi:hypothetical protein